MKEHESLISLSEVFGPTIQGEGALIGKPTVFVRTGGCDYRCSWCDSLYAVLPQYRETWGKVSAVEIFQRIRALCAEPILITLSGGNPAMQPLAPLLRLGRAHGDTFCCETQGTIAPSWFADLEYLTLSPKPPSSGMETNWTKLSHCVDVAQGTACSIVLKVVVFDDADYLYARHVAERYPWLAMYLQTGNSHVGEHFSLEEILAKTRWLAAKVIEDHWTTATVLPQFHTLLWGTQRGV